MAPANIQPDLLPIKAPRSSLRGLRGLGRHSGDPPGDRSDTPRRHGDTPGPDSHVIVFSLQPTPTASFEGCCWWEGFVHRQLSPHGGTRSVWPYYSSSRGPGAQKRGTLQGALGCPLPREPESPKSTELDQEGLRKHTPWTLVGAGPGVLSSGTHSVSHSDTPRESPLQRGIRDSQGSRDRPMDISQPLPSATWCSCEGL